MTDHIDQLLHLIQQLRDRLHAAEADAAEWRKACSGRTMSCSWCNDTAKKHDELQSAVRKFVFEESKFAAKSFCSTIISYGDERPRAWRTALRAMERML